ncbi:MAG: zinc ribbon domain-containing protein, partial [Clostridiales bacterium]|nr:zinc ribbon domain-containing protein [Clostridiales bacterium]
MQRCPECNTQYEGKYCPACGTKWQEEKTCPQCGATSGGEARFCNECGYAFVSTPPAPQQTSPKPHNPATAHKAYAVLRYVPIGLLALFAVLLFAFYAAPVGVMPNPFGGKAVSYGNVYGSVLETIPELNGIVIALWISAVFALLYAAATAIVFFYKATKYKDITLFGKFGMGLGEALGMGGFIVYLLFAVLSAVVMGKLGALDSGTGMLQTGSMPIVLLVFSILFAAIAAGAIVTRHVLNKKNPQFGLEETQRKLDALIAEEERKERFFATHNPPVCPVPAENMKRKEKRAFKKRLVAYKHNKRRYEKAKEGNVAAGVVWLDTHKAPLITVAVFVIAVTVFLSIFLPWFFNIFRVGVVEKIDIGDGQSAVESILGKPYEGTKTDEKWEYYDKAYTELMRKQADKAAEAEKAMLAGDVEKAEKLSAEAQSLAE